jgi:hypothetical protein
MASKSVAEITAETMDNYLLLGHILKCSVSSCHVAWQVAVTR